MKYFFLPFDLGEKGKMKYFFLPFDLGEGKDEIFLPPI
jgi:hypothetical protein